MPKPGKRILMRYTMSVIVVGEACEKCGTRRSNVYQVCEESKKAGA